MIRSLLKIAPAILCLALAACGGVQVPQTPAQAAYALRGTLIAALGVANTYEDLPSCLAKTDPTWTPVCSDNGVIAVINAAAPSAGALVNAAVAVVSDPASSAAAQQAAVDQAAQAVANFQALIPVAAVPKPAASLSGVVWLAKL
jgi:hypothetical protein